MLYCHQCTCAMWCKRLKIAALHCSIKKEPFMRPGNLTASKALFLRHEERLSPEDQTQGRVRRETAVQGAPPPCGGAISDFWPAWPGALMTGREPSFPLRMASVSCSRWKCFLGEVFCLVLTELKKLQALSLPLCRCKSLVKCAWSPLQPCFSVTIYDSQASPHAMCWGGGGFGERWPQ